jgi:hybrid cluster-associated redox disulfide protein
MDLLGIGGTRFPNHDESTTGRKLNMAKSVSEDMIIREVLKLDEGTAPIFMKHGMHCLYCPSASGESLRDACAVHGIDPKKLVSDLNQYLNSKE